MAVPFVINQDYHIHSFLSSCSSDPEQTPARIVQLAQAAGLTQLCLTDHLWDADVPGASRWYEPQNIDHVRQALPLPSVPGVEFRFGCETDLDKHMVLGLTRAHFDLFDFVIIPTTHLHMSGFTIDPEQDADEVRARLYVERLDAVLSMDIPFEKVGIAHLTCRLIAKGDWDRHIRVLDMIPSDTFRRLFSRMAEKGCGFELNFPVFSYSEEQLERILRPYRIAKACGCRFYFGSDIHHPQALENGGVRKNFERIAELLALTEDDRFKPAW